MISPVVYLEREGGGHGPRALSAPLPALAARSDTEDQRLLEDCGNDGGPQLHADAEAAKEILGRPARAARERPAAEQESVNAGCITATHLSQREGLQHGGEEDGGDH